jgi:hypothetical protein
MYPYGRGGVSITAVVGTCITAVVENITVDVRVTFSESTAVI